MAYKPRIESNNLDLTSILATINELPEASKGVSIDVITASSLPATVVENQIVVITDTAAGTIYVDTDEPANPVSGDVWVQVGSSDYGVEFSETFRNGFNGAKQYSNGWAMKDGYVGASGTWQQFAEGFPAVGTPLSDWAWQQIVGLANSGEDVTQYFAVGDEKDLVLSTGEVVPVVIGAFNHNPITGKDKKAAIAFTFKNCLNEPYAINASATTAGGWQNCAMRRTVLPNLFNTFPDELKAEGAIKYVDVVSTEEPTAVVYVTLSEKLRLHSVTELGLTYAYAQIEGTAYPYYASGNRIKKQSGIDATYWTRSIGYATTKDMCCIYTTGVATHANANAPYGVALAFDI